MKNRWDAPAVVYFMRDRAGELLYVGCTTNLRARLAAHERSTRAAWFPGEVWELTTEPYARASEASVAEAEAIRGLHPRYNLNHNRRYSLLAESDRLNLVADAVLKGWGYVPLSVRHEAARAADAIVAAFMAERESGAA